MGQDPKPKKSRKTHNPAVSSMRPLPLRSPADSPTREISQASATQTRIPPSQAHDREIRLPGLHNEVEHMAGIDPDGYLKISFGDEGKSIFIAWRWQRGEWAGHYVMARVLRGELAYGLSLLSDKVAAVRGGWRKPTLDRYGS